jgi:Tfp pilus assembly protein PilX
MLRAQHLARQDARSDRGSAMLIASIVTILLFSMLGAFMTMTNLNKSATNAYIDGNNTFYAAESGLNRRASQIRDNFVDYATPNGTSPLTSTTSLTAAMSSCFPISTTTSITTNDFECRNYPFRYNNNAETAQDSNGNIVLSDVDNNSKSVNYTAFTFVADKTNYATSGTTTLTYPTPTQIPAGQTYSGLNAQEYRYVVYATAAKPSPTNTVRANDAKTVLQMEFKSRIVPLFQFAAFYDGDLEMNSSSNMTIGGRVHTNADLYVQPATTTATIATTFTSNITAAGRVYNRVDAGGGGTGGTVRLQLTPTTFLNFPAFGSTPIGGLSPIDLAASPILGLTVANTPTFKNRVKDSIAGIAPLTVPDAGFLRKRNYYKSNLATSLTARQAAVGEYWAKADMRLEMVPDRDVTAWPGTFSTQWPRNAAIIPFNFTSIQTGGSGTCSTTPPMANQDPTANYIDPNRNDVTNLKCNIFTKGQLQSLRQPVLVLQRSDGDATLQTQENTALGKPTTLPTPGVTNFSKTTGKETQILNALQTSLAASAALTTALKWNPTPLDADLALPLNSYITGTPQAAFRTAFKAALGAISGMASGDLDSWSINQIASLHRTNNNLSKTVGQESKIIRALQVALASTSRPVPLDSLAQPLNDSTTYKGLVQPLSPVTSYGAGSPQAEFKAEFKRLIANIPGMAAGDLDSWTPQQIAALQQSWFLSAPIQRLTSNTDTATGRTANYGATPQVAASNYRSSGFYDGREKRWITMLQTNIKSLSVWNRDGLYVKASGAAVTGTTEDTDLTTAYAANNDMKNAAFNGGTGANFTNNLAFVRETNQASFPTTPATGSLQSLGLGSSDTTEGGLVFHATVSDDLNGDGTTTDVTHTTPIYKLKPDGTRKKDTSGNDIVLDYVRQYWSQGDSRSPFGFAFNGGDFLPAAMNVVTDQAIYIQGDFNNNNQPQTQNGDASITAPNPDRLPAAIMADTITILSNQCNTSTSPGNNQLGLSGGQINCGIPVAGTGVGAGGTVTPPAPSPAYAYQVTSSTAVNAAFLSYTDRSTGNCKPSGTTYACGTAPIRFSGAINNYIRMLEDWNQAEYFNYSGSFVSLGAPAEYSGRYIGGGTYYMIPVRNFNFDSKFDEFSGLPPLSPRAVYLQQDVFKRNF